MTLTQAELDLFREVVSLPTAPFCEQSVQSFVVDWAQREGVQCRPDPHGNLLLEYPGKGRQQGEPWVLQAHMDHPGFVFISRRGRFAQAWFRGGVNEEYFSGTRMQFFPDGNAGVKGTVVSVRKDKATGFLRCRIELDEPSNLAEGALGMWDLPVWRRRGDRLHLRVADDLAGVAAVLLTLSRLKRSGATRKVFGLLTRAEEVGFVGATAAAEARTVDPAWPILGIEASKAQVAAPLGGGVVVRLGDKMSVFDADLTMQLREAAGCVLKKYSEALMPGGSTESTLFALVGYRTCAVCLPLGNYHNMGADKIAAEQICVSDVEALLDLLMAVSQSDTTISSRATLKERLMQNYTRRQSLL